MSSETTRTIDQGAVSGRLRTGYMEWLGLPYAAPPVGALRWKAPAPPLPWEGVRDGAVFGAESLQAKTEYSSARGGDEDCLYLNVYAPTDAEGPLPVMVWLHGGGFMNGSGNAFNGGFLAQAGVIVVTVNYRLGPLGWLALPSLAAEAADGSTGNYGLLDSMAALRWVRENIAAFGGEAARVTVFGQSAGGEQVLAMLASPLAAGLFEGAISMSAPAGLFMPTIEESVERRHAFFKRLGCTPDTPLDELRSIDAQAILDAADESWNLLAHGLPWTPTIDGVVLPEQWIAAYQSGRFNHVPVMIGHTRDEGRLFKAIYENVIGGAMSAEQAEAAAGTFFAKAAGEVVREYDIAASDDPGMAFAQAFVDGAWATGEDKLRTALAARIPVFGYETDDPNAPESHVHALHSTIGAGHDSDLQHLFGWDDFFGRTPAFTVEQVAMAEAMRGYWTAFAAAGDPNRPGLPAWQTAVDDRVQAIAVESAGGVRAVPLLEYREKHRMAFWNDKILV